MIFSSLITLEKDVSLTGVGIHSGQTVTLHLIPRDEPGWVFVRTDLDGLEI